jgi:protein-tyrosine phosphatase
MTTRADSEQAIARAVSALDAGELVAFPTETVYGLAARADRPGAVEQLRSLAGREDGSFAVHVPGPSEASAYAGVGSPVLARFLRKAMPGPYTVVLDARAAVVERERRRGVVVDAVFEQGELALRCPAEDSARRLIRLVEATLIAGAATVNGQPPATDAPGVLGRLGDRVAVVLDGGPSRFGRGSTRVKVTLNTDGALLTTLLAEGVYDGRAVEKLKRFNLLLVCTGNTCRSPMAEVIARSLVNGQPDVTVGSAGVFASAGAPASAEAVQAMSARGLDLSNHRSRTLTREMLNEADAVYTMTEGHRQAVLAMAPELSGKVQRLLPDKDVEDPIGGPLQAYEVTAERITAGLEQRLKEALA